MECTCLPVPFHSATKIVACCAYAFPAVPETNVHAMTASVTGMLVLSVQLALRVKVPFGITRGYESKERVTPKEVVRAV